MEEEGTHVGYIVHGEREREVGEGMTSGKENEYFVTKYQQGNYSRYGN